jgi:hypothetical protein
MTKRGAVVSERLRAADEACGGMWVPGSCRGAIAPRRIEPVIRELRRSAESGLKTTRGLSRLLPRLVPALQLTGLQRQDAA